MTTIAVAGGTGGVGKTIVETLLQEDKYQVIVLTRGSPKEDPALLKTRQVQINYNDVDSVAQVLDKHAIRTIISAISIYSDETSQSQLNLIQAAEKSTATKTFIPSEYSFIQTKDILSVDPSIKYWLAAAELLHKSSLKYTRVTPGIFMDYWGMPNVRTNLQPCVIGIDVANCWAAIPGDGNDRMSVTYSYDMAAFIVKLLDLEEWPEFSVFVGDEITYNELLELAEQVRGKKFEVVYDSVEKIKEGDVTIPSSHPGTSDEETRETAALVSRLTIAGAFDLPKERMNTRFPDLKPLEMREFLLDVWENKA
ncbi:NmrA-like family protein [Aspergillus sclerotioniger CBS 115572]|uniref:NmrA-like family protein n=1 Tax=Aspergillus sclerotioniger CBS 115572 TaxID=1450535 RepID=A0A317WTF6_9EURO|nr:NmrA-like family protein [Aspergillus sclerotioniger CBS 115572]PWY89636.1 NmrA-like family protein [Aspergillus sclerotioniger CBS 115572]